MKDEKLSLRREHMEEMIAHAERVQPEEACGLLAGKDGQVWYVISVTNILHSPVRFRMDPEEQVRAFLKIESDGLEITGIYHSHPEGPSTLSPTDLREAAYPDSFYLLLYRDQGHWRWHGYTIRNGIPREAPVVVGMHDT